MGRAARATLLFAAISSTACAALLGFEGIDYGGTDSGADGASNESSTLDVSVSSDASDASSFCADAGDFCDDFERTTPLQGRWSASGTRASGSMGLEGGTFVADIRAQDAAAMETPAAGLTFSTAWDASDEGGRRRAVVSFRALLEECPLVGQASIVSFALNGKALDMIVQPESGDCYVRLQEIVVAGPTYRGSNPILAPLSKWEDYEIELGATAAGEGGTATLRIGAETQTFTLTPTKDPTEYGFLLGVFSGSFQGADARIRFEHVITTYLR